MILSQSTRHAADADDAWQPATVENGNAATPEPRPGNAADGFIATP